MANVEKLLIDAGGLLKGHFCLTSGLHSDTYFQCAKLYQYPDVVSQLAQELAVQLKNIDFDIELSLDDQYDYILRRWYDKNIKVSHAMEYLKNAPDDIKKELALEIIDFIKEYTDYEKNKK